MKKTKYLASFIFSFIAGFLIIFNYNGSQLATNVVNSSSNEENYYKDYSGNFWTDKKNYESYRDEEYFLAPDGTYWINEYRYEQSKIQKGN